MYHKKIKSKLLQNFFLKIFLHKYYKYHDFSIFQEKWDNLIILDACRYDYFEKVYKQFNLPGKLEKRISSATETTEFLKNNFRKKHDNVVYVSANPFVDLIIKDKVFKIISVWNINWDDKYNTVHPKSVFKWAIYAAKKYTTKKIIIHFIQPHYPYIGYDFDDGSFRKLKESAKKGKIKHISYKTKPWIITPTPIYLMKDIETQKRAYLNNLLLVMKYVEKLVNILPGKTIITADHGEAFGEKIHPLFPLKIYGHPVGIRHKVLVEVPWLVVDKKQYYNDDFHKYDNNKEEIEKIFLSCKIKEKIKYLKNN